MHRVAIALACLLTTLGARSAVAQPEAPRGRPPALLARVDGGKQAPLTVRSVGVDVRIVGHLAETRMTLTFGNPHARALEGDLVFPLPEGAALSGYALDVHGAMVDGVAVEKDVARQVFETEVRKGIDPGLVEWVKGNAFRTRVFPIPARGSRTVMVRWVEEVTQTASGPRYRLPLAFTDRLDTLKVRIEVVRSTVAPRLIEGPDDTLRFDKWRSSWVAEATRRGVAPGRDLVVGLPPLAEQPVQVERAPDGTVYFSIRDPKAGPLPARPRLAPRRVTLLWDASLSRARADHAREIAVVRRWLAGTRAAVDLVVFRHRAEPPRRFQIPEALDALAATLGAISYDGGTQIGSASNTFGQTPDLILLVSDGVHDIGKDAVAGWSAPIWALSSGGMVDHGALRGLALQTGGGVLDLTRLDESAAVAAIGARGTTFGGAAARDGAISDTFPRLREPVTGPFHLVGRLGSETATVALTYGDGAEQTTHTFEVRRADAVPGDLLERWWAQRKLRDLTVAERRNRAAITALGKRFGLVTPFTSLLVLESLSQYVEHGIRPPASLPELRARFDATMDTRRKSAADRERAELARVLAMWKEHVTWWETRFDVPAGFRYRPPGAGADAGHGAAPGGAP